MWKAILVLFLSSSTQPMSTMMGHFPKAFPTKAECQAFIDHTRREIDTTVDVFTKHGNLNFKVLSHELSCVEDTSGDPA